MGFFDFLNKKTVSNAEPAPDKYIADLKKYAIQFVPGNIDEISTQREMLKMVMPVIPVNKFIMDTDIPIVFKNNSLGKISILQLQGAIAANTDRCVGSFKEKELLEKIKKTNTEALIKSWIVIVFYCGILKPEYKINLEKYVRIVVDEIYNRKFIIPIKKFDLPVEYVNNNIYIDSANLFKWKKQNPDIPQYELCGALPLTEKQPVICLYEDGVKTREYCLQTEGDEDFTGKYFLISVRLGILGNPAAPIAQIDGFVSDTPEERKMTANDIGYRMEGHFLVCGGDTGRQIYEKIRGQDLPMKGLKYPGYTTPSNIRLIGICPDCGKSFCFHGYAFYMAQSDVGYSDDGLDCCEIQAYDIDKDTWIYETEGKTFRYYNSFNCPHCGAPYIDYKKYPQNKVFGVSGCVHLGRTPYKAKD